MITRNDIINELLKHKGKDKSFKKNAIKNFLDTKKVDKKQNWVDGRLIEVSEINMILADLESYDEYQK